MATSQVNITGSVTGLGTGSHQINIQIPTAFGLPDAVNLAVGFNSVAVPTGVIGGVIIKPPSANAQTIVLKGITGDTGQALSKVNPTLIPFDTAPPATIGLTAGGTINNVELIWF